MQVRNKVNPSRRVVNLLQDMAKKITEEGPGVGSKARWKLWQPVIGVGGAPEE